MSYSYSTLVSDSLQISQDLLSDFAKSNDFTSSISSVFGDSLNPTKVEELKTRWSAADFNDLPAIEVRSANEMNGALGAYAAKTDTIYLSEAFLQQADKTAISAVLLEEIGHGVDARLNAIDTPGDEGHIFSAVVRGETVSAEQMQALRTEDDTATLMLDGQAVDVEMASKQYSLSNSGTWEQAQAQAQNLGANLVTVNNAAEQQFLVNTFGGTEKFWIGLTDKVQEGAFKWANGEPVGYTNWNSGEPNNANNEDYVAMNEGSAGKWNDFTGSQSFQGIIEKEVEVSSGYLLSKSNTWVNAQAEAQSLGGNLVAIADAIEQQLLVNTFGGTEKFWIGLTDKDQEGNFKWANPEPVGYTNWNSGEPNNLDNEDYVGMNNGSPGKWNDHNGSQSFRGIIEIIDNVSFLPSTNAGEPSTNGEFKLSLSRALPADFIVPYTVSGSATAGTDYQALSDKVVIPAGATTVSIPVNVIDDFVDEDTETITLKLNGGKQQTIELTDNDTAGITVIPTSGTTTEKGGQASFGFKLNSQPLSNVTIDFSKNSNEGVLSNSSLTFTPGNWNSQQTLTVTGQDDNVIDGDQTYTINASVFSNDSKYKNVSVSALSVTNIDDDFNTPPTVAQPINNQTAKVETAFNFQFAENTFNDINGDKLNYTATLANGSDLPSWLSFDSGTRTFSSSSNPTASDVKLLKIKVTANDGTDSVSNNFNLLVADTVVNEENQGRGTPNNDAIAGGTGKDIIRGGDGDDIIAGNDEADRLHGDGGNDVLDGGSDDDFLEGGTDNDDISGGTGNDFLLGETGQDTLTGGDGNDVLMGGNGDDILDGGAGGDRLGGFAGNDIFVLTKGDIENTIYDFEDNSDRIGLELSSFTNKSVADILDNNELTMAQIGANVALNSEGAPLATVYNANMSDFTAADFISI